MTERLSPADIDPADIWENYCAEVPDPADRSPQGAMAFACEHLLARHAQQPSRDERLWALARAIECVDAVPTFHQLIGEKKQKTLLDFKNDLKNAIRNQGLTEAPAAQRARDD
jgi:hypothetical protein